MNQAGNSTLPDSTETGRIKILHLKRFWSKCISKKNRLIPGGAFQEEWLLDHGVLNALGVSLEDSLSFVYNSDAGFDAFENWIIEKNKGSLAEEKINSFNSFYRGEKDGIPASEKILSDADLDFFEKNGYVIIRQAVTPAQCRAAEMKVWEHLGADPDDPSTWYDPHPDRKGIMIQLFHDEALEATRRSEKIRQAYVHLYGHGRLLVTTDRVSFNPPETGSWTFPWPHLHWDVRLDKPVEFGLQGLLYLTDTKAEQGAFRLVPGFQHRINEWLASLPPGRDPQKENLEALGPKPIAANAGDFIIWHH
ncbi:MAG TPA: phytanoyl-CoA dioxygenase family protein, partial [Bacteroidia bacterium]|nr:phytanoyl-CoA dioxygenase family protein [Bacteroidia bacterium]